MRSDIDDIIAHFDGMPTHVTDHSRWADTASADIEYYIQLDEVTARLYKDYREAQERYAQLDDGTTQNAAMRDVARDMRDSAWSALQTRLIEMREGDERAAAMKAMHNLHGDRYALRRTEEREREQQRQAGFRRQCETAEAQKEQSREEAANALLAYVFLFWFQLRWAVPTSMATPKPRSAFSQVA